MVSEWCQRTSTWMRFVFVLVRLRWIRFLTWLMPFLPLSRDSVGCYTAWIDGQLDRAFASLRIPLPTFEETRRAMDVTYADRGTPLRWIHPMVVKGGVITSQARVHEGTVVSGHQGSGRFFAYLEPTLTESSDHALP